MLAFALALGNNMNEPRCKQINKCFHVLMNYLKANYHIADHWQLLEQIYRHQSYLIAVELTLYLL